MNYDSYILTYSNGLEKKVEYLEPREIANAIGLEVTEETAYAGDEIHTEYFIEGIYQDEYEFTDEELQQYVAQSSNSSIVLEDHLWRVSKKELVVEIVREDAMGVEVDEIRYNEWDHMLQDEEYTFFMGRGATIVVSSDQMY